MINELSCQGNVSHYITDLSFFFLFWDLILPSRFRESASLVFTAALCAQTGAWRQMQVYKTHIKAFPHFTRLEKEVGLKQQSQTWCFQLNLLGRDFLGSSVRERKHLHFNKSCYNKGRNFHETFCQLRKGQMLFVCFRIKAS